MNNTLDPYSLYTQIKELNYKLKLHFNSSHLNVRISIFYPNDLILIQTI